jgi:6-phosphogluconolactonase (cycloisomerase 2 family)
MSHSRCLGAAVGGTATALAAVLALAGPASASTGHGTGHDSGASAGPSAAFGGASHVVFVQTDNTAGNQVVAFKRAADGTLSFAGVFNTGGLGGQLTGSVTDHLASQGALTFDPRHSLLYAVNAGSNTVSVFVAHGHRLFLQQVIGSGGQFPVSVAVHGNLVYVLNALNGGSVRGYREFAGRLFPIRRSTRPLHLDPNASPQFVNTPGQVAFSPDGSQLLVTTKANGSDVDVFGVRPGGRLTASPVVNPEPGAVPFAVTFDPAGTLVIAEAGTNALATFTLNSDGTIAPIDQVGTGQAATCWVIPVGDQLFASNTGSGTISRYTDTAQGSLALAGQTATDPGPVDMAATPDGRFLYAQAGGPGTVDEFSVTAGALTEIGSVTVPNAAGGEGIAAA